MTANNLALWDSVRTPDPAATKSFSRGGGFKGTATNAVYLIRRATELWGPMGEKWGVDVVSETVLDGAPLLDTKGAVVGSEKVHTIRINLRHPGGTVPGIGQTMLVGKNKNGFFTDEEAPKKSLTDALTKALSWLGFAADIHLGLWDDNKYVNAARQAFADEPKAAPAVDAQEPAPRQQRAGQDIGQVVQRIVQQVAAGNAAQPASWLATLSETKCKAIMDLLDPGVHDAITAAWPDATEGAAA
jgi:hypothetical protein